MSFETDTFQKEPGELLLGQGKLSEEQLEQVRRRQRRLNVPQHRAILDLNFASEEDTWRALATANHLEFVDPVALDPTRETAYGQETERCQADNRGACHAASSISSLGG